MAVDRNGGATPLDRLRTHLETDLRCPDCGFEDDDGSWTARTDGGRVLYRHVCPSCGSIRTRDIRLGR